MTCNPRQISGNDPLGAVSKDYNRYCDRIVGNTIPGGSGPAPSPVTPGDLANLVRWYKADGLLYRDSLGTDPVGGITTNLDPIGFVTDGSPEGNDLIQATPAAKPTWFETAPDIHFDGGDYITDAKTFTDKGDVTIGFVMATESTVGRTLYGEGGDGAIDSFRVIVDGDGDFVLTTLRNSSLNTGTFSGFTTPSDTRVIVFVTLNAGATVFSAMAYKYIGGSLTEPDSVPKELGIPGATMNTGIIGSGWQSGGLFSNFTGSVNELFITQSVLTIEEMAAQGAALAAKWGVA